MNRELFIQHLENNQRDDLATVKSKNQDYADGADPFQNFRMVEDAGLISAEKGIAVRMSDKLQRIFNLLDSEASVKDETIADTLSDLRNYANILQVYLQQEKGSDTRLKQVSLETDTDDYNRDGDLIDWETAEITVDSETFQIKELSMDFEQPEETSDDLTCPYCGLKFTYPEEQKYFQRHVSNCDGHRDMNDNREYAHDYEVYTGEGGD